MAVEYPDGARDALTGALRDGNVTLYLGAGVSVGSGLPMWETLLLTVYFERVSQVRLGQMRPFPNYLFAIAEWYLKERREPPELMARKLRQLFEPGEDGQRDFVRAVGLALYGPGYGGGAGPPPEIHANATLAAVAGLCSTRFGDRPGVRSVITYNYDDLLERALEGRRPAEPIGNADPVPPDAMPVFHVHGFLPFGGVEDRRAMVVLSEQEYNAAASDPYAWPNLVQLREMSTSIGLMVGLSITDRNIRRLLDVLGRSPVRPRIFALMKRPAPPEPGDDEIDWIDGRARAIMSRFQEAGVKSRDMSAGHVFSGAMEKGAATYQQEIRKILSAVDDLTQDQELNVLRTLGIAPVWYDDHGEIPHIIQELVDAAR